LNMRTTKPVNWITSTRKAPTLIFTSSGIRPINGSPGYAFFGRKAIPEVWDPVSGSAALVTVYRQDSAQLVMPLTLAPYQSCFVVFRKQGSGFHYKEIIMAGKHPPLINYTDKGLQLLEAGAFEITSERATRKVNSQVTSTTITGPWKIKFPRNWGAPDSATFDKLISWTESPEQGIKYFSGTATYSNTFRYSDSRISAGERVYLDLGDLSTVAEAWLNGRSLGITWAMPFRFDVTGLLQPGENTLIVETANAWANRIVGDAITGEKFTNTNLPVSTTGVPWAKTLLVRSGLLGPVKLVKIPLVK